MKWRYLYSYSHSSLVPSQQVEEWGIFTGCTQEGICHSSINSCGDDEGFFLRFLCDWDLSQCMSLLNSLVNRLYLQSSLQGQPGEPCPHSFFFVIDTLMHRQRVELPEEEDEEEKAEESRREGWIEQGNNDEHQHQHQHQHDDRQEIPIRPAHTLVFNLLTPMLHIVQATETLCASPHSTSSSITALYRIPNDKNTHYFGDTPRPPRREPYYHSDVTLWHLYELSRLHLLLDFFEVDSALQQSISRHMHEIEKQIRRHLRWSDGRGVGDRGKHGVDRRIGYGTVLPLMVGLEGVGGVTLEAYTEHLMDRKSVGV